MPIWQPNNYLKDLRVKKWEGQVRKYFSQLFLIFYGYFCRVEPDIAIVEEPTTSYVPIAPKPMQMQHTIAQRPQMMSRGRGRGAGGRPVMSPAAQAAMRVKAQLRAQTHQQQQPQQFSNPYSKL